MEKATHDDIWKNFINNNKELKDKLLGEALFPMFEQLAGNLYYATAMCRIHYLRNKDKIPEDLKGLANYWKVHYNTPKGAGKPEDFINKAKSIMDIIK